MSDNEPGLLAAILAVQSEAPAIQKDKINPAFRSKYVSLDSLMEAITPVLTKHGLVWNTFPCRDEGEPALRYRLTHASSGESCEDVMPLMLAKTDPQGQGSAITYARRYSLMAVLGLVADEDDDGNKATRSQQRVSQPSNGSPSPKPTAVPVEATERPASAKQRGLIFAKAAEEHMPASVLANIVLISSGAEPRDFESEDMAQDWLKRSMDRLPARLVTPILASIQAETV